MESHFDLIAGYKICNLPGDDCVRLIVDAIRKTDRPLFFACANPHSLVTAENDDVFRSALEAADWLTPDGVGIVLASRMTGGSIRQRVTGYDVFQGLSKKLAEFKKYRCFFLGSTDATLREIVRRFESDHSQLEIAGTYSPPFKPEFDADDSQVMINAINDAKPDILWVGMTAPKQETWIYKNIDRLDVSFVGAIGAVFDFYAGSIVRPGPLSQRLGMEWLGRLIREPRRLWRRNLVSTPLFIYYLARKHGRSIVKSSLRNLNKF